MPAKGRSTDTQETAKADNQRQEQTTEAQSIPALLQRAYADPSTISTGNVQQLQRAIGNRATLRLLRGAQPIQAKLTIGQTKPLSDAQRHTEDETLQAKPASPTMSQPRQTSTQPTRGFVVRRAAEDDELRQDKSEHSPEGGEVRPKISNQVQPHRNGRALPAQEITPTAQGGGAQRELIQAKLAGTASWLRQQGGGLTGQVITKKVFSLGIYHSTYEKILGLVTDYEREEAKGKKHLSWFLTKLIAIEKLCNEWLGSTGHKDEQNTARASAITTVRQRVVQERTLLSGPSSTAPFLDIEDEFDEKSEISIETTQVETTTGGTAAYDFGFEAKGGKEIERERIFTRYVDNCKLAGLPIEEVLTAARVVLGKWGGWDHPAVGDFDYAYVDKFKDRVLEDVKGATVPIVKACFTMNPNVELLRSFAVDMEPVQVEEEFRIENEREFVETVSSGFDNKGDKAAFIKLWETSRSPMRRRIYSLVSTDKGIKGLTTMGYLVEALDKKHRYDLNSFLSSWSENPTTLDFFTWLESQHGANEKTPVRYYNQEERAEFAITVGRVLKRANTEPLVGDNIFVMSKQNVLYAANKNTTGSVRLHHSSFLSGEPVKAAGHLYTDGGGQLYKIDNSSGHYGPNNAHLAQALAVLKKQGVDLNEVEVRTHVGGSMTAEEFLSIYL